MKLIYQNSKLRRLTPRIIDDNQTTYIGLEIKLNPHHLENEPNSPAKYENYLSEELEQLIFTKSTAYFTANRSKDPTDFLDDKIKLANIKSFVKKINYLPATYKIGEIVTRAHNKVRNSHRISLN